MKLSKLNRGAVFTAIVVLCVVANVIFVSARRSEYKKEVEVITQKYYELAGKYAMLPEKYRDGKTEITQAELDEYIGQMKKDFSAICLDNDIVLESVTKTFADCLELQQSSGAVISRLEFGNSNYRDNEYSFSEDTIRCVHGKAVSIEILNSSVGGEQFYYGDLCFQRVGSEWKLLSSSLDIISHFSMGGMDDGYRIYY